MTWWITIKTLKRHIFSGNDLCEAMAWLKCYVYIGAGIAKIIMYLHISHLKLFSILYSCITLISFSTFVRFNVPHTWRVTIPVHTSELDIDMEYAQGRNKWDSVADHHIDCSRSFYSVAFQHPWHIILDRLTQQHSKEFVEVNPMFVLVSDYPKYFLQTLDICQRLYCDFTLALWIYVKDYFKTFITSANTPVHTLLLCRITIYMISRNSPWIGVP